MSKPEIAAKKPAIIEAEAKTYFWCHCGRSARQPYCDGSHKGTSFTPLKVEISEPKKVAFCQCKQTSTPPYCDGSHSKLTD